MCNSLVAESIGVRGTDLWPTGHRSDFKTIDFLTLLDLDALRPRVYARFMKI